MTDGDKGKVNWAMICHLGGLATYIGLPLGNILVPLVIWFVKRNSDPAVEENGREAVNFNLTYTLYGILAGFMCFVLIGWVLLPIVLIAHIALAIQAALKVNRGQSYHYPYTLRFIKE